MYKELDFASRHMHLYRDEDEEYADKLAYSEAKKLNDQRGLTKVLIYGINSCSQCE